MNKPRGKNTCLHESSRILRDSNMLPLYDWNIYRKHKVKVRNKTSIL